MGSELGEFIPGYEGQYSVTKDGRVYSHARYDSRGHLSKGKWLNPAEDNKGYLRVNLYADGVRTTVKVHRLVAQVFIPNQHNKPEVNHINGDKADNTIENLEWSTGSENLRHAFSIGLKKGAKGVLNGRAKLSEADVIAIRGSGHAPLKVLSNKYRVTETQISTVRRGKAWGHI